MSEIEELALQSKGCVVSYASSLYGEASKMIDGQRNTYWCSSGLYPQAFVLSFSKLIVISAIKIRSYLVRIISVEKCTADTAHHFENLCETELGLTEHCHQTETLCNTKFTARHLRFTIQSGYDHICAVYRIEIEGSQNRSGGSISEMPTNEFNNEKPEFEEIGSVTSLQRMGSFSPRSQSTDISLGLNALQPKKPEVLGRTLGQSPRERGTRVSSSVVPPLWTEEEEEAEGAPSPSERVTRMLPVDSDLSSEEEAP